MPINRAPILNPTQQALRELLRFIPVSLSGKLNGTSVPNEDEPMSLATSDDPIVTPDDLLAMPDGDLYELVDGKLVERTMGIYASLVASRLSRVLGVYCDAHGLGEVLESEAGYKCFPGKPNQVRKPDVSFISASRVPSDLMSVGYCETSPDLAAEVISPTDSADPLFQKIDDYLGAGVRLIWVLIPKLQMILIFRRSGACAMIRSGDALDGEDVVPGFTCPVDELFKPPMGMVK
jgi:Uma2 family endonuclease